MRTSAYLGGLGALVLLDTFVKYRIFSDPFPLPFYAKQRGYFEEYLGFYYWNSVRLLKEFLLVVLPLLIVLIAFIRRQTTSLALAFLLPALLTFAYLTTVVQIMGFYARFYFPALPFFAGAAVFVFDRYLIECGAEGRLRPLLPRLMGLIVLGFLFSPFAQPLWKSAERAAAEGQGDAAPPSHEQQAADNKSWLAAAEGVVAIMSNSDRRIVYAMSEYGVASAMVPDVQIIDLVGLHDPYFAKHGFDGDNFFSRQPDLIWFPPHDYISLRKQITDHEVFRKDFEYFPEMLRYGVAIRRSSPWFKELLQAASYAESAARVRLAPNL